MRSGAQHLEIPGVAVARKPGAPMGKALIVLTGTGIKVTKGRKTERIWYYDFSHEFPGYAELSSPTPLTLAHFGFAPDGSVLEDAALPASLVADWQADEARAVRADFLVELRGFKPRCFWRWFPAIGLILDDRWRNDVCHKKSFWSGAFQRPSGGEARSGGSPAAVELTL